MNSSSCPFCNLWFPSHQLQRHANTHFDDEDDEIARDAQFAHQIALAPPSPILHNQVTVSKPFEYNLGIIPKPSAPSSAGDISSNAGMCIDEKISLLVSLQLRSTLHKVEVGLTALLRSCLESETENSTSLLSGHVDHFQSIDSEDVGWGCGWRNIQMLTSHLLVMRQEAREVLFGGSGFVPDIASLQRWLEIAWEMGFDIPGSDHFDHTIYGSRKWIGATECATLFRSFGLRARIVDFGTKEAKSLPGSSRGAPGGPRKVGLVHGPMDKFVVKTDHVKSIDVNEFDKPCAREMKGHQVLVDCVWNYFSENKVGKSGKHRVIITEKMPLYFQHDGHSRTIIGIQVKHQRNGSHKYNLLILDPAHRTEAMERSLVENIGWQKLIKRGVHTLRKPQYQLCYIDPGVARGEELQKLKTLDSIFHEF